MFGAFTSFGKLGALASSVARAWSPAALWPTGTEPGMWIDPSNLTSQWQDSAGTTPVSTPGTVADSSNPVGLALDIRAGAPDTLGPELVTNGDFSGGTTGWTVGASWTIGSGIATSVSTVDDALVTQGVTLTSGKTYQVTYTILTRTAGVLRASLGGVANGGFDYTPGTYTYRLTMPSSQLNLFMQPFGFAGTIDNISVKEVPGNHLLQATSTARPLVSGRVNLLTKTENIYSVLPWSPNTGDTVNQNALTVGALSMTRVTPSTAANTKGAYLGVPQGFFTIHGKANGYRYVQIYDAASATLGIVVFDLQSGTFTSNTNSLPTYVSDLGGGLFRFGVKLSAAVVSLGVSVCISGSPGSPYGNYNQTGDGVSGVYLGGIQANLGSAPLPYQAVVSDSSYTATGFPVYQKYDGTDDGMATASFAAGTLSNAMDCMIAVRRDSTNHVILGPYNAPGDLTKYLGNAESGYDDVCYRGPGSPTVWVDGTQTTHGWASELYAAVTVGDWHIVELRGLDLSAWLGLGVGSFGSGYNLNGARGDIMLYPSTASTEDKDKARQYLADKYGVTLA